MARSCQAHARCARETRSPPAVRAGSNPRALQVLAVWLRRLAVAMVVGAANRNLKTTVWGNDSDYLIAREWPVTAGRLFSREEIASGSKVAIIGRISPTSCSMGSRVSAKPYASTASHSRSSVFSRKKARTHLARVKTIWSYSLCARREAECSARSSLILNPRRNLKLIMRKKRFRSSTTLMRQVTSRSIISSSNILSQPRRTR